MFNSIIQTVSKPFQRSQPQNGSNTERRDDRVEDGFLLVGDTASERTIINAKDFNPSSIDAPPCYGNYSKDCLPSYREYTSMTGQSSTQGSSQFPHLQHGNPCSTGSTTVISGRSAGEHQPGCGLGTGFTDSRSGRTAISDIPFELASSLQFSSKVRDLYSSNLLQPKSFDYSVYYYNFNLEYSFLNEQEVYRENDMMDVSN